MMIETNLQDYDKLPTLREMEDMDEHEVKELFQNLSKIKGYGNLKFPAEAQGVLSDCKHILADKFDYSREEIKELNRGDSE